MAQLRQQIKKARETLRILGWLFHARMNGQYLHSTSGPHEPDFAIYKWKGKTWKN